MPTPVHTTALLVIDVQKGLFHKSIPIHRAEELLNNINCLVETAHRAGAPVIYVQHSNPKILAYGTEDWQLHPRLHPADGDSILDKQHGNAFEGTCLDELLKSWQIGTLVITGLVTHGCVRATCNGAVELGYKVILVEDGHSSYSKDAARLIVEWNQKLAADNVTLAPTSIIKFDGDTQRVTG